MHFVFNTLTSCWHRAIRVPCLVQFSAEFFIPGENNVFLFYVSICYGNIRVYTFIVKDVLFPSFYVNRVWGINYFTPEIGLVITGQLFQGKVR